MSGGFGGGAFGGGAFATEAEVAPVAVNAFLAPTATVTADTTRTIGLFATLAPTASVGASAGVSMVIVANLSAGAGGAPAGTVAWSVAAGLSPTATLTAAGAQIDLTASVSGTAVFVAPPLDFTTALTAHLSAGATLTAYHAIHLLTANIVAGSFITAYATVRYPVGIDIVPKELELRNGQHVIRTALVPGGIDLGVLLSDGFGRRWRLDAIEPTDVREEIRLFLVPLDGNIGAFPVRLNLLRNS